MVLARSPSVRAIVVATHGIMTKTTRRAWTDDFRAFFFSDPSIAVEKKEYRAGLISIYNVFVRNRAYARGLADEIEQLLRIHEVPVHFVGHSNGTDINLGAIKILATRGFSTETMIATGSVLDPDIEKNGIAELIDSRRLGKAFAYCGDRDLPLKIAPWAWPYSNLGRVGWRYRGAPYEEPRITTRMFCGYGHGDFFAAEHQESTFRQMSEDMGFVAPRTEPLSRA